jgi:glutathione synthase/RimK-type ligase-like ATP-grasp enzyme
VPDKQPGLKIWLPAPLCSKIGQRVIPLRYGATEALVQVYAVNARGGTRRNPLRIVISPEIIRQLAIRTEPIYRLLVSERSLEIGPVLGLLLGNRNHWYDDDYLSREPERVNEVYRQTGGLFCAFSPRTVSLRERCAYGLYYDPLREGWQHGAVPLPAVMHRRSFHIDHFALEQLKAATGATIFNSRRFHKWELHEILSLDPLLREHLPETELVTDPDTVFRMAKRHSGVILKPSDLSRGRGILFVKPTSGLYRVADCRELGRSSERLLSAAELTLLLQKEILPRPYLCQQLIDLAQIGGAPFDIRIVMQRSPQGRWRCTGIECRLAGPGQQITNIAHGGRALYLNDAVQQSFGSLQDPVLVEGNVVALSERLSHLLDQTGGTFAEFGVDIGLDRSGRTWLIEANVLPTFKGFKLLNPEVYRKILASPLLYANYAAGFGDSFTSDE